MKKLILFFALISLSAFSKPPEKCSWLVATFDTDAQAFIDSIGDCPYYFQIAINDRVLAFKADSTWNDLKQCLIFPGSQDADKSLFDLKKLKQDATYGTVYAAPYATNDAMCGNDGALFGTNVLTGFIKTGFIPSSGWTINSSAWAFITDKTNSVGLSGYNFGALQANLQSITFDDRNASNQCTADLYSTTSGSGRLIKTLPDGAKGVYIGNRQSSTNFKIWKNGAVIASCTSGSGSLPTTELYLNCQNANGVASTKRNKPIAAFCLYGKALTDAQAAQESADWQIFLIETKRTGNHTKSVVFDGNSQMVMWRSKLFRQLQYENAGDTTTDYYNVATAGKTTPQLITRATTNTDVLYNPAYSKNILVFWEITNDIGSTNASAIEVYNNVVTYCTARRAVGWKVIILPPMARAYSNNLAKIIRTDSVITMLKTGWPSFADAYCDYPNSSYWISRSAYASDAAYMTAVIALTNGSPFYDKIHLLQDFYEPWCPVLQTQINAL